MFDFIILILILAIYFKDYMKVRIFKRDDGSLWLVYRKETYSPIYDSYIFKPHEVLLRKAKR